ncbi:MAG TPA: hypothetical protein V6D22_18010 [Candidatus Obscuribacterales bacterium]
MKNLAALPAMVALILFLPVIVSQAQAHVYEGQVDFANTDATISETALSIEWDHWRNHVVHAAWTKWGELLAGGLSIGPLKVSAGNGPGHNFPVGTRATFHCSITRDRRIEDLSLTESSGDPQFDRLVLASVRSLQGSRALSFPKGSQRASVEQSGTFRIGKTAFHEARFSDVEQTSLH